MIGRNEMGEITFTAGDRSEIVDALKEIMASGIGQIYKRDFYVAERGDDDLEKILKAAQLIVGGSNITVAAMTRALELLIDSGEIQPRSFAPSPELTEPEPDTRPRDKNGKLLTEQQIQWSEYRQFAETASMAEINRRKQTDSGFANFVRKNWERQLAQPVGDAVTPVGMSTLPRHDASQHLVEFAKKYQAEPSQNLKPRNGVVILAGEQIPYLKFIDLVNKCTAAFLL